MNIHYNTEITSVDKLQDGSFHLLDQKSNSHHCKVLVIRCGGFECHGLLSIVLMLLGELSRINALSQAA